MKNVNFETLEYTKYWEDLLGTLERFKGKNPEMTVEVNATRKEVVKVRAQPYTIAVCGEVKTGKSTVLNALLFKRNVLPTFATPLTAKLTFIRYTEGEPYFEVEFLSKKEFKSVQEDADERTRFSRRVEICQQYGVFWKDWIGHEKIQVKGLEQLAQYVSDPENQSFKDEWTGPIYTPMVKCVHIYINNNILERVTIVDTPGLNDPNPVNSRETSRWVNDANAVLYILNLEGPNKEDRKFFNEHSLESAKDARIFVQNKIDNNPAYAEVKKRIYAYGMEKEFQQKGLFSSEEVICSYSAKGVLLKAKKATGEELTEEEENFLKDMESDGIPEDPDNLMEKLSEKLCNKEGKVRVSKAKSCVRSLYTKAIQKTEEKLNTAKTKYHTIEEGIENSTETRAKLREFKRHLKLREDEFIKERDRQIMSSKKSVTDALGMVKSKILSEMDLRIRKLSSAKDIANSASVGFTSLCWKYINGELQASVSEIWAKLTDELKSIAEDIRHEAIKAEIPTYCCPSILAIENYIGQDMYKTSELNVRELYKSLPYWFSWQRDKHESAMFEIEKALNDYVIMQGEKFRDQLAKMGHDLLKEILNEWYNGLEKKEKEVEECSKQVENGTVNKKALECTIRDLQSAQNDLVLERQLFDNKFGV